MPLDSSLSTGFLNGTPTCGNASSTYAQPAPSGQYTRTAQLSGLKCSATPSMGYRGSGSGPAAPSRANTSASPRPRTAVTQNHSSPSASNNVEAITARAFPVSIRLAAADTTTHA